VTTIADIVAPHLGLEGRCFRSCTIGKKTFGHVSKAAIREIAQALNLTRAEVYSVVSSYHDFRKEAEARPIKLQRPSPERSHRSVRWKIAPFIAKQTRLTFARARKTRPTSLEHYYISEGWFGLAKAREIGPEATIDTVFASGSRGRCGAGFPAGIKWKTVAGALADRKYIVCNADDGDSATLFDDSVNMAQMARFAMEFCAIESCGKCTPCRLESTRGTETIDQIIASKNVEKISL
jgi:hypothetical protein